MQDTNYQTIIIGGGIAGMQSAISLHKLGVKVLLIEKEDKLGGHLNKYYKVFPNFKDAYLIVEQLAGEIEKLNIPVLLKTQVVSIEQQDGVYAINISSRKTITAETFLFANGFENFDAAIKEEYGYGIYPNVVTSLELEDELKNPSNSTPKRIAFVHCVGSRDEKTNNFHCSKVCCITAVKQAIELKERYPDVEIICLYMDLRMYDNGFEELYREAQIEHGIQFIRGRLSETSLGIDNKLIAKVQDTIAGVPMRIAVDKLVLMVGKEPLPLPVLSSNISVNLASHGFILPADVHLYANRTSQSGVFCCGTSSGPKTIRETIADTQSAAIAISEYITKK
jgi:heterodisulfide reductase subunit A